MPVSKTVLPQSTPGARCWKCVISALLLCLAAAGGNLGARKAAAAFPEAPAAIPAAAPAPPSLDDALLVEDVRVIMTSGTLTLRDIRAEQAVFREKSRILDATSPTLALYLPEQNLNVTARAASGRLYLSGHRRRPARWKDRPLQLQEIHDQLAAPDSERIYGDLRLFGPIHGETADGGRFEASGALWSEFHERLMAVGPFYQRARLPGGREIELRGEAFQVDSTLRQWTYHYTNRAPFRGELLPAAPLADPQPKGEAKAP